MRSSGSECDTRGRAINFRDFLDGGEGVARAAADGKGGGTSRCSVLALQSDFGIFDVGNRFIVRGRYVRYNINGTYRASEINVSRTAAAADNEDT